MKAKEVIPPNPLTTQAKQLQKRTNQVKRQAHQLDAAKKVTKARESLTKAVRRQANANKVIPSKTS